MKILNWFDTKITKNMENQQLKEVIERINKDNEYLRNQNASLIEEIKMFEKKTLELLEANSKYYDEIIYLKKIISKDDNSFKNY